MYQTTQTATTVLPPDPSAGLNYSSSVAAAQAVIDLALRAAKRPIVTTKFGPYSPVLLHLLVDEIPNIPVVWVDTGFNSRATLRFAEQLILQLNLNLQVFRPAALWQGFVPEIEDADHGRFTEQVKLEPFNRALDELAPDLWFSSLRTKPNCAANNPISTARTTLGSKPAR